MLSYSTSSDAFRHAAEVFGGIAGAIVSIFLLWQYVRWLFRSSLGGYRLRLVPDSQLPSNQRDVAYIR